MKLPDVSTNYQLEKFIASYRPVKWLLNIFSLHFSIHPGSRSKVEIFRKVLSSGILCAVVVWSMFYKIMYFSYVRVSISIKVTDTLQLIFDYVQSVVDLYYVQTYGRRYNLQYFNQYLKLDKILGIDEYIVIRKRILKFVIIFIIIWVVSSVFDFLAISLSFGCLAATVYSSSYLFVLVKTATIMDLTSQIIHVQYRITYMSDYLHSLIITDDILTEVVCVSSHNNRSWMFAQERKIASVKSKKCEGDWISKTYLGLLDQTNYINELYGLRILLNSLSLVIDLVKFFNLLLRLILNVEAEPISPETAHLYFPIISNVLRIFTSISLLLCLVIQCEKTYRQREKIINLIDHQLALNKLDDDLSKILIEFRPLVESRPLEFHLNNFFRLDYSFLTSTASVVVTYTIILLQNVN